MEFAPQEKLLLHMDRLAAFAEGRDAAPALVEISPTNDCNAKCPWCFYVASEYKQKHSKDEIDIAVLRAAMKELSEMRVPAITWTGGGDPSVYSGIDEAIDHAHSLGLKQGMFTNAYKPIRSPEKLEWIRITVTEKFTITKHVAAYAKATKVGVNFNLCAENGHHLVDMALHARDAGAAYFQVRPALADRWDLQKPVETPHWLKERYETDTFRVFLTPYKFEDHAKPHSYPVCHGHRFVPTIWHNGDVAVCGYHFGKDEFTFGNLNQQTFSAIWHGERRWSMLDQGVAVIPQCQHCCYVGDTMVIYKLSGDLTPRIDSIASVYALSHTQHVQLYSFSKMSGVSEWKDITARFRVHAKKVIRLKINGCPDTEVSLDHPVDVIDGGFMRTVRADELVVGQFVPICTTIRQTERSSKSAELEKAAYLIGYFIGDGSLCQNARFKKSWRMEIAIGAKAARFIERVSEEMRRCGLDFHRYHGERSCVSLVVNKKAQLKLFVELFGGQKAHTKRIPDLLMDNSDASRRVIAGLIDTDGTVAGNAVMRIRLCNRRLIEQVGLILAMNSINYTICQTINRQQENHRTYYELSVANAFDFRRLIAVFGEHSIKLSEAKPRPLDASGRRRPRGVAFFIGDVSMASIRAIETVDYDGYVYDFEVADNHTFLVNSRFFGNNCKHDQINKTLALIKREANVPEDPDFI